MGDKKSTKCSVNHCTSCFHQGDSGNPRFFRFPKPDDAQRVFQWKLACGDENIMKKDPVVLYSNHRICSRHFETSLMTSHRLNKTAVPTLNLVPKQRRVDIGTQTENLEENEESKKSKMLSTTQTQTSKDISNGTPRKTKLRNLVKSKTRIIRRLNMDKLKLENSLKKLSMLQRRREH